MERILYVKRIVFILYERTDKSLISRRNQAEGDPVYFEVLLSIWNTAYNVYQEVGMFVGIIRELIEYLIQHTLHAAQKQELIHFNGVYLLSCVGIVDIAVMLVFVLFPYILVVFIKLVV